MSYQDYSKFWAFYADNYDFAQDVYTEQEHGVKGLGLVTSLRFNSMAPLSSEDRVIDVLILEELESFDGGDVPDGVKMLVLIDCDPTLMDQLPESLVSIHVVLSCEEPATPQVMELADLPCLKQVAIWDCDEAVDIQCQLPEGVDSVYVNGARHLTVIPPAQRGPTEVELCNVVDMAPWTMDSRLRKLIVTRYRDLAPLPIRLVCSDRLETLEVDTPVTVDDRQIVNFEEYRAYCLNLRRKKPARR